MEKLHFDEIDICKGIAMLLVLWHHSFILFPINMLDIPWCHHAMAINGTFFMEVFFVVSGYLFAFSRPRSFGENLANKVKRLLIPYISFGAVTLGLKLLVPSLVNRNVVSTGEYLCNFVTRGGELWFVYVLFLIFVIWPPLLHKISRKSCVFVILVLLVSDIALPSGFLNDIFMYNRVVHFSIFFLTGYMLRDFDRDKLGNKSIFATLTVLFIVFNCVLVESVRIPIVGGYVLSAIGCSFVWMLSYKLSKIRQLAVPLQFVGKYSLPFYWLNGFALVLSRTLVVKILHFDNSVLIVVSIFLLCVFLETLAVLCIRKLPFVGRLVGM